MLNILKKAKKKKINAWTGYLGPCKVSIQGNERIWTYTRETINYK